jgi:hypothetical protein
LEHFFEDFPIFPFFIPRESIAKWQGDGLQNRYGSFPLEKGNIRERFTSLRIVGNILPITRPWSISGYRLQKEPRGSSEIA